MNPNYSRDNSIRKRKEKTGAKAGHAAGFLAVKVFFVCFLAVVIVGGCAGAGILKGLVDSAPDISNLSVTPSETATYIYDQNGTAMQKLTLASSNRTLVTLDQIPEDLQHAVVAIEDQRFYQHKGIDIPGIARAFVVGITSGSFSEGASTITQQLLKNNVFTNWTQENSLTEKFRRKFQEQYLALELEKRISKDQILEDYLNTINLGAGAYGVQAAAHRYFGKDVSALTLSESAVIAGITQNPTRYNPITNPENNAKRRETVLKYMTEQGYITQEQQDEALADPVYDRIQATDSSSKEDSIYTYYEDALIEQVLDDLQEQLGYTYQQAYKALYTSGLKIYSAQDASIQQICDEEFSNAANFPSGTQVGIDYALSVQKASGETIHYGNENLKEFLQQTDPSFNLLFSDSDSANAAAQSFKDAMVEKGDTVLGERISITPQPQASLVIIDQSTGYVKAIVGGRGKKEASLTLNRATDTTRQPGSTFKILSTYAPALNEKGMTLATTFEDEPYEYPDGTPVRNSNNSYGGETTIRKAIQNSVNVVAVKCLEEVTPSLGLEYLDSFGFTTLAHGDASDTDSDGNVYSDANLPLALGGITYGVTNVELNAAYSAIANGGKYIKPIYFTKILDREGNVLIDNTPEETEVIKESTAWLLTNAMEDVVKYGTATNCQLSNMPVAGKTGTTDTYNDLWFVGYTPYYCCAVWSGYDNNEKIPSDYMSRNFHKLLWQKVMSRLHEDLDYKDFEQPPTVEKESVCSTTGLLPRLGCPTVTEYFDITSLPTQRCEKHYYTYTPPATDYDDDDTDKSNTDTGTTGTPTPDPGENPGEDNTGEEPGEDPGENPGGEDPGTDPGEDPGTEDPGDIPTEPTGSS